MPAAYRSLNVGEEARTYSRALGTRNFEREWSARNSIGGIAWSSVTQQTPPGDSQQSAKPTNRITNDAVAAARDHGVRGTLGHAREGG